MAKIKKPLLPPANFNPSVFSQPEPELPAPDNVTSAAAALTGQELPSKEKTVSKKKDSAPKKDKKSVLSDKSNRVGITALIEPSLLKKVKIYALDKNLSMSDVCNLALSEYLEKHK